MKKEISLFIITWSMLHFAAFAQTGYYRTFADYENNRMEVMDDYKNYTGSSGNITLIFMKGAEKVKVKCAEIWGFKYKSNLFRMDGKGAPAYVDYQGKIIHYRNGIGYLKMLKGGSTTTELQYGYFSYLSEDLKSEMFPIDGAETLEKFKSANPKYGSLADCISRQLSDGYYAANIPVYVSTCIHETVNKN